MSESLWSTSKGQTEPLAALIAVAAFSIGISIYAGYVSMALPGTSQRAVEEPTTDRVWDDIRVDGAYETEINLTAAVDQSSLPPGFTVYVEISRFTEDGVRTVDDAVFYDSENRTAASAPESIPEEARSVTRSIPVRTAPGNVTAGRLRVVVWE